MKEIRCFDASEIAAVLDLGPDDPRRRHLAECPRCRALALSFQEFLAPESVPDGARPAEAVRRLSRVVADETAAPTRAGMGSPAAGGPMGWFGRLWLRPPVRTAWAMAALVVVAGGVFLAVHTRQGREPVLRGPQAAVLALQPVRLEPDGALRLCWAPLAGAERYQVRLYSTALAEVVRLEPVTVPEAVLRRSALPRGIPPGTALLWRVAALRGGDDIAQSPVGTLRAP